MKLATSAQVLARLNLAGIATANAPAIDSALEGATTYLESKLRTSLHAVARADYYSYNLGQYETFSPFKLWLSQGFVDGDVSLYMTGTEGVPLIDAESGTQLVLGTDFIQDKAKGCLTVLTQPNQGYSSLATTYEAGYSDGSTEVPVWMQEGAVAAAILLHHNQGITHSKKDAKDMSEPLAQTVYAHIKEYIFTRYGGLSPISTVID